MVTRDLKVNMVEKLIELDRKSPRRIMVIGDGMTDVYIQGHMEECQEGCLKFVEESAIEVPGGAANAARSLTHWNAYRSFTFPRGCGPVKTRFMVGYRCVFRHDDDSCEYDSELLRTEVLNSLHSWKPDGVLLSDYDKGLLIPEFIREIIDYCTKRSIVCVADAKREPELYKGSIIKSNWDYSVDKCFKSDVVTCGEHPPIVHNCGLCGYGVLPPVNCINYVGAGDCFAAHLTLALTYGFSLRDGATIAHSAGRVYVQKPYNTPPSLGDIVLDSKLILEGSMI